jgi:hypothetical protein
VGCSGKADDSFVFSAWLVPRMGCELEVEVEATGRAAAGGRSGAPEVCVLVGRAGGSLLRVPCNGLVLHLGWKELGRLSCRLKNTEIEGWPVQIIVLWGSNSCCLGSRCGARVGGNDGWNQFLPHRTRIEDVSKFKLHPTQAASKTTCISRTLSSCTFNRAKLERQRSPSALLPVKLVQAYVHGEIVFDLSSKRTREKSTSSRFGVTKFTPGLRCFLVLSKQSRESILFSTISS